jgi:spermidine synthase
MSGGGAIGTPYSNMILLLFFCSGATALIYEVVWSKYLALMFGSTIQAQTVVLAVFMGGLALGNRLIGSRSDLLRQPLAVYGYIEVLIGLYAFFFNVIYSAADNVFVGVGSKIFERGLLLLGLKGLLSVSLLVLPTVLMGGTLPLLAAWLQKESSDPGRRSARFYSVNSLGAVFGAGLAGFFLVPGLGMISTLQMTALANVIVGITAVFLARREVSESNEEEDTNPPAPEAAEPLTPTQIAWSGVLVAVTGGVAMGLEVLASRSLSLIFGASLQAFAIVLMAFILGIGVGSAIIASPRAGRLHKPRTTILLLFCAALCLGAFVVGIEELTILYAKARTGLAATEVGYFYHQILLSVISILVLGLPAALLGSVLPLWIRLLAGSSSSWGDRVGRLLTWNTLGAVVGVLLTGFVLMPTLGLRGAIGGLAILLSLLAALAAWLQHEERPAIVSVLLSGALLWICVSGGDGWRHILGSGVFRLRATDVSWNLMDSRKRQIEILFYEDASDATVSVETGKNKTGEIDRVLRINGKPDASTRGDLSTQYLMAHLPMLARPESKEAFVLGFGSGITAGALLGHPIERLTIAENCKPILKAGKLFEAWNRGVLTNSRTRVCYEDGRTVLRLDPQRYDVILSEPSNPWLAGVGSVFSQEFYRTVASRLKDDGIMAQWFHSYEMSDGIVFLVLRTFSSVFPFVEIWDTQEGDMILLGGKRPWKSSPEIYRQVYSRELPRQDLEILGLKTPESILTRQIASQVTGFAIAGEGPMQSDGFPILEYAAPKAFYFGAFANELYNFDERTWQSGLAPAVKRAVLNSLPDELLGPVFERYTSSNRELLAYLTWRKASFAMTGKHEPYQTNPYMPVLFRTADTYPAKPELQQNASADLVKLSGGQALILSEPARWQEGVEAIESVLLSQSNSTNSLASLDWLPGHFAALAARTRIGNNNAEDARKTIALGLKIVPKDNQLLFLQRIVDRAQSQSL